MPKAKNGDLKRKSSEKPNLESSPDKIQKYVAEQPIGLINSEWIEFQRGSFIIFDDCLISRFDSADGEKPSNASQRYLETLQMIELIALEKSHHWDLSLAVTAQFALSANGNSHSSHCIRNLMANFDFFIIFKTSLRDMRLFLQSFVVGEKYREYKDLYNSLLEMGSVENPSDERVRREYLLLSFHSSSQPKYSIRQFLFNIKDRRLFPFVPPCVINFK